MDAIPPLRLAEVIPVAAAKRDPHPPTSQPNDVMTCRIPARSSVEGSGSAERQPKLVVTEHQPTVPSHARPPAHDLSLEPLPAPSGGGSD